MTEDERKTLVKLQMAKAHHLLEQADEMCDMQHWDMAANRFYYACFHAVQGLFIAESINGHTHSGCVVQFSLHFVKSGRIDKLYGSFLARMMQLRQKADYNCAYDISKEEVQDIVALSHDFIQQIEKLLRLIEESWIQMV